MKVVISQQPDTPLGSVHGTAMPILPDTSEESTLFLSDVSSRDKWWDQRRKETDLAASYYRASTEPHHRTWGNRMHHCSDLLEFILNPDKAKDESILKLVGARFCRVKTCPVCQNRRSMRWKAKAYEAIPKLVALYPSARYFFLTLTVKNCPVTELRATISHMNKSFHRLVKLSRWPALGYIRATEVTRGDDGSAHPHFHCMVMVKGSYFSGKSYIKQAEWAGLWKRAARLDYEPVVDVRAKQLKEQGPIAGIPELLKYVTKSSELLADQQWFLEYSDQIHNLRMISVGGVFKDQFKDLEKDPEDLIGKDDEQSQETDDQLSLYFDWKRKHSKYGMKN